MRLTTDLSVRRVETKYGVAAEGVPALLSRIPADEREEYGVRTLYFDRPDWSLARAALKDPMNCTKVRSREYPNGSTVWFEVKTRQGCWTRKSRLELPRPEAARLFGRSGVPGLPVPASSGATAEDEAEARRYLQEILEGRLRPVGTVVAHRVSLVLKQPLLRITLDRDIAYYRPTAHPYVAHGSDMPELLLRREPEPVLEVKHVGVLPPWCDELLSGLERSTYSKFRSLLQFLAETGKGTDRVDRL